MQAMIGLPSGLDRVRWKESDFSPQPSRMPRTLAPRARGVIEVFEHQRAGAFGQHETVAVLGERFGGLLRRIVLGRQRRQQREAHQRFRRQRTVGADRKRRFAFAAPDRFHAELDRGGARRAGGVERDRRAFGAEMLGEMLADDAEFEASRRSAERGSRATRIRSG